MQNSIRNDCPLHKTPLTKARYGGCFEGITTDNWSYLCQECRDARWSKNIGIYYMGHTIIDVPFIDMETANNELIATERYIDHDTNTSVFIEYGDHETRIRWFSDKNGIQVSKYYSIQRADSLLSYDELRKMWDEWNNNNEDLV